ncbi:sulfotransferase domain-containing protein [Zunongwangia sp.]|uniref:sulfotransferase domain-containing protein n=1 Tax=Zunongwangia sp. TaxID=1965325 RepID=UPI003AA8E2FA
MDKKVVIILGMHRSGTSVTANWLNVCGLNLGDELYGASKFNKNGYYEDIDFLELHMKLLQECNIHSSGHEDLKKIKLSSKQKGEIKKLIINKNVKLQWGWKEPRTCLFIEYYKKLIPNAVFLVVYRDYKDVVASLILREHNLKMPSRITGLKDLIYLVKFQKLVDHYSKIWLHYNNLLIQNLYGHKNVIFTNYKDLLKNDKKVYEFLISTGVKIRYISFSEIFDNKLMQEKRNKKVEANFILKRKIKKTMQKLDSNIISNK